MCSKGKRVRQVNCSSKGPLSDERICTMKVPRPAMQEDCEDYTMCPLYSLCPFEGDLQDQMPASDSTLAFLPRLHCKQQQWIIISCALLMSCCVSCCCRRCVLRRRRRKYIGKGTLKPDASQCAAGKAPQDPDRSITPSSDESHLSSMTQMNSELRSKDLEQVRLGFHSDSESVRLGVSNRDKVRHIVQEECVVGPGLGIASFCGAVCAPHCKKVEPCLGASEEDPDRLWDHAIHVVDKTTEELARVMAVVQNSPAHEHPALFARMRALKNNQEYVSALSYLENPSISRDLRRSAQGYSLI